VEGIEVVAKFGALLQHLPEGLMKITKRLSQDNVVLPQILVASLA
jgi:hypothetical protein